MLEFIPLGQIHDQASLNKLSDAWADFWVWNLPALLSKEIIYIFCTSELCLPWRMIGMES